MADWDPELYNRFRKYRAEPVEMMLEHLEVGPAESIIDLGCGTGENTVELARRTGNGQVIGIDSSPAMIARAEKLCDNLDSQLRLRVKFELRDIRSFTGREQYTIIFSNAALQWVPDHQSVFAACFMALKHGGRMVVQVPANENETAQAMMRTMAAEPRWHKRLGALKTPSEETVLRPDEYSSMLQRQGFAGVDCFYHTFHHPMRDAAEIVEFCRSTSLRRFLEKLEPPDQTAFMQELTDRLIEAYGTDGPVTFDFRRLFIWARRP